MFYRLWIRIVGTLKTEMNVMLPPRLLLLYLTGQSEFPENKSLSLSCRLVFVILLEHLRHGR